MIRFLYGRPLETLLATWGISLVLQQAVRSLFGAQNVPVENPNWLSGGVAVMSNLVLPYNRIAIIAFAFIVLGGVALLIAKTRFGLFIRGVTQNRRMASCVGVDTAKIDMLAFSFGAGIAGLGGVALSQIGNVGPDLGQSYIVDSFLVVVLGGVGQLAGTVVAGLGLGVLNKLLEGVAGRGAGEDRGAGLHRHLHPEKAVGPVRDEGPERRGMSAVLPSPAAAGTPVQRRGCCSASAAGPA